MVAGNGDGNRTNYPKRIQGNNDDNIVAQQVKELALVCSYSTGSPLKGRLSS